jgi:hypothetical protein
MPRALWRVMRMMLSGMRMSAADTSQMMLGPHFLTREIAGAAR